MKMAVDYFSGFFILIWFEWLCASHTFTNKKVRRRASALLIYKCLTGLLRNPLSFIKWQLFLSSIDLGRRSCSSSKKNEPKGRCDFYEEQSKWAKAKLLFHHRYFIIKLWNRKTLNFIIDANVKSDGNNLKAKPLLLLGYFVQITMCF